MYEHDVSEEAYKKGFTDGYVRGVLDRVAEAMNGTIEWYKGIPKEDLPFCYICIPADGKKVKLATACYKAEHRVYFVDEFEGGNYVQRRLGPNRVSYYAKLKDPPAFRLTFEVPEARP